MKIPAAAVMLFEYFMVVKASRILSLLSWNDCWLSLWALVDGDL